MPGPHRAQPVLLGRDTRAEGHEAHAVADALEYWPIKQLLHVHSSVFWYVPESHGTQLVLFKLGTVPGPHTVHPAAGSADT